MRFEDVERYLRVLNLLRFELSSSHPAVELEMRSRLVTATNPVSGMRAVTSALEVVRREPDARRLFLEVVSRVDPGLPLYEAMWSELPPPPPPGDSETTVRMPGTAGSAPPTGTFGPLAGDVTPTPALDLVCPNDLSHPGARIGFFNRLMPPSCPYCRVRLVERRDRG